MHASRCAGRLGVSCSEGPARGSFGAVFVRPLVCFDCRLGGLPLSGGLSAARLTRACLLASACSTVVMGPRAVNPVAPHSRVGPGALVPVIRVSSGLAWPCAPAAQVAAYPTPAEACSADWDRARWSALRLPSSFLVRSLLLPGPAASLPECAPGWRRFWVPPKWCALAWVQGGVGSGATIVRPRVAAGAAQRRR